MKLENDTRLLRSVSPFGAELRTPLCAGFIESVSESVAETLGSQPCLLAKATLHWRVADNPRRLLHPNDDSIVGSTHAYPCSAWLGGIPGWIPRDPLLTSLWGLMVSRYPRGYAVSPTPGRQEFHLHGEYSCQRVSRELLVVTLKLFFAPIPSNYLRSYNFRETDRTCNRC